MTDDKIAQIREAECIGCTKCLKVCPVDAIFGALNQMHLVIQEECIGCELCIAPCPVDCIDLIAVPQLNYDKYKAKSRAKAKIARDNFQPADNIAARTQTSEEKKRFIAQAVARIKAKRG